MTTTYVSQTIKLNDSYSIHIDGNDKITDESYNNPLPNAFSLPHIATCPGATQNCLKTCYVFNLQKNALHIYSLYIENERSVHAAINDIEIRKLFISKMIHYLNNTSIKSFRWHVSGDIFNQEYALLIKEIVLQTPNLKHWLYTRSYKLIGPLLNLSNLTILLSTDQQTYQEVKVFTEKFNLKMSYLTLDGNLPPDLPLNAIIFPDYSLRCKNIQNLSKHIWWQSLTIQQRKQVCPADFFGHSQQNCCKICKKCFK